MIVKMKKDLLNDTQCEDEKKKNIKSWGINEWESEMRNPICVCDYIVVAAMYWMSKDFSSYS